MKKALFVLFLIIQYSQIFAQIPAACPPTGNINADECSDACVKCNGINGYCSNSAGYTSGSDGGANFCPGSVVENNLYVAFISNVTGSITFNITTSNCQGGPGLHGAIYGQCGNPSSPLVCNSNLSGNQNWSMTYGGFVAGCVYYIMLEGLSSATDCNFCINTAPSNATVAPSPPAFSTITQMPNSGTICPGTTLMFSVPSSCNSKIYDWVVTGPGIIIDGETTNKVTVLTTGVGTMRVCVKADNGCKTMPTDGSYLCKDVIIKEPEMTNKTVYLCCEEDAYTENGNIYSPPCGEELSDIVTYKTINNCDSMVKLKVIRRPQVLLDLGEVPICKGEKISICKKDFDINSPPDIYYVDCQVSPKDAKNFKCDTTKYFVLTHIIIDPKITPVNYTFPCPGNRVTIDGSSSVVTPNDPLTTTIKYQWQEYIAGQGWTDITGATLNKYTTDRPGQYRLKISVDYKYKGQNGVNKVKKCEEYSVAATLNKSTVEPPLQPMFTLRNFYCHDSTYTFTVNSPDTNLVYKWTSSLNPTDTILGVTATFKMVTPITQICLVAVNKCNVKSPKNCQDIRVLLNPDPAIVSGSDSVCVNTSATYCITNFDSTATYTWKMPTGASFTNGPGLNCITVSYSTTAQSGNITVDIQNECGQNSTLYPILILPKPQDLQNIIGNTVVCAGDTVTYSTNSIGATSYSWKITPAGTGNFVGSNSGGTVSILWNSSGTISVKAINNCGESNEISTNVTVNNKPIAPIISGVNSACEGTTFSYSIDSLYPNTTYSWAVSGGTLISGQGTKIAQISWGTAGNGTITVTATNQCGNTIVTFGVNIVKIPTPVSKTASKFCGLNGTLSVTPSNGVGFWSIDAVPNGGNAVIANPSNINTTVTVTVCGNYRFKWTESIAHTNGSCTADLLVSVNIVEPPKPNNLDEVCNGTKTAYNVSFEVVGCAPPYKIFDGANNLLQTVSSPPYLFTSNLVGNNLVYNFIIEDSTGCRSLLISGQRDCQCITDAGTLSSALISVCEDQTATVSANNDYVNDGNDTYQFVLHDKSGSKLGTIFDINKTGTFAFQAPLQTETTYYISRIAGNKDAVLDTVVRTDKCLQVSVGQPVIWRKYPNPKAGVDDNICGNIYLLKGSNDIGGVNWQTIAGNTGTTFNLVNTPQSTVTVPQSGVYQFEISGNNFGCIKKDTVEITFYPTNLSVVPNPLTNSDFICDSIGESYRINFTIQQGTAPYIINNQQITGNTFLTNWYPIYKLDTLTFTDSKNCATIQIPLDYVCPCLSKVSSIQLTNSVLCEKDTTQFLTTGVSKDPNDALEYVLSTSDNVFANPNTILARNPTGKFTLLPTMTCGTTYYVTAFVGNASKTNPNQVDFGAHCVAEATTPIIFQCQPKALAGLNDTICGNSYNLLGQNNGNIGNGTWTQISGVGNSVFSDPTSPTSKVDIVTSGVYTYQWSINNNGCKDSSRVQLSFGGVPQVSTFTEINEDKTGFIVRLTMNNGFLPYSIDNKTIVGNVWFSDTIPCKIGQQVSLNYVVSDMFGCKATIPITETCRCIADAGTLNAQIPPFICDGNSTPILNIPLDTIFDVRTVGQFILNDKCGVKTGTIVQKNKNGQFAFDPNTMQYGKPYYISFIVGDSLKGSNGNVKLTDICLDSTACATVTFVKTPVVSAGADDKVCGSTYTLKGSSTITSGTWVQLSGSGIATFDDATKPTSSVSVDQCGTYSFEWTSDANGCIDKDTVTIDFSFIPKVTLTSENCNSIYTNYTVQFDVDVCFAPATITGMGGGNLSGKSFTSNAIDVNSPNYNFTITDAKGCQQTISGVKDCKCKGTVAGNIVLDIQSVCVDSLGNGSVKATYNGFSKDANDTYHFVLTDAFTSTSVGTIFDQNKTGVFKFKAGMQYGKTYYVAAVLGDSLATGLVNLTNNPCLQVVAKSVIFIKIPTITITAPSLVDCIKSAQLQGATDIGTGIWKLKATSKPNLTANFSPSDIVLNPIVTVSDTGTYRFTWQVDNDGCSIIKEFLVKFTKSPTPKIASVVPNCNSTDTTYRVVINLTGTTPFRTVTGSMSGTFAGNVFTSAPITSSLPYTFVIKDAKSCDSVVITGKETCPCKANAGTPLSASVCAGLDTTINLQDLLQGEDIGGKWSVQPTTSGLSGSQFRTRNIAAGTYTFTYLLSGKTTAPPCEGDTSIVIIKINPSPKVDAGIDALITCKQSSAALGTTPDPTLTYQWSSPNGGSVDNPSSGKTTTTVPATYVLTSFNSATGCKSSDTVEVKEQRIPPTPTLTAINPICNGDRSGKVFVYFANGIPPYQVNFNNTFGTHATTGDTISFNKLKEGDYPIIIEDAAGCQFKDSIKLVAPPAISTTLGPDITIDLGDSKTLTAEYSILEEEVDTIIWSPMRLDSLSHWADTLTIQPKATQKYCITLISKNGCQADACVMVNVVKKQIIYIPNVFRPDSDVKNNKSFFVNANEKFVDKILTFEIYNRWGDIVYKLDGFLPNDPDLGWNGTFNGKLMDPGVFVYFIKIQMKDGTVEIFKGDVTLVR